MLRYWVLVSRRSVDGPGENTAAAGGFVPRRPFGSPPGGITGTLGAPGTPEEPAAPVPPPGGLPPLIRPRAHAPLRARSPG